MAGTARPTLAPFRYRGPNPVSIRARRSRSSNSVLDAFGKGSAAGSLRTTAFSGGSLSGGIPILGDVRVSVARARRNQGPREQVRLEVAPSIAVHLVALEPVHGFLAGGALRQAQVPQHLVERAVLHHQHDDVIDFRQVARVRAPGRTRRRGARFRLKRSVVPSLIFPSMTPLTEMPATDTALLSETMTLGAK